MKKFIKIVFRDKRMESVHLPIDIWSSLLDDPKMLVKYVLDGETEWKGRSFNKSEVISSDPDEEYTKQANVQRHDLYKHIPTNSVRRIPKGTLLPPGESGDYELIGK